MIGKLSWCPDMEFDVKILHKFRYKVQKWYSVSLALVCTVYLHVFRILLRAGLLFSRVIGDRFVVVVAAVTHLWKERAEELCFRVFIFHQTPHIGYILWQFCSIRLCFNHRIYIKYPGLYALTKWKPVSKRADSSSSWSTMYNSRSSTDYPNDATGCDPMSFVVWPFISIR